MKYAQKNFDGIKHNKLEGESWKTFYCIVSAFFMYLLDTTRFLYEYFIGYAYAPPYSVTTWLQ